MTYDPRLSHFDLDMKRGAQGELLVNDICDMLARGKGSIEVKTDYLFFDNMRLYVETECRGRDGIWRPSGLSMTKARFWAFVLGEHPGLIVVETDWLRRATELARADERNHKACKYGENPTRGVTVYMNHFRLTREPTRSAA